MFLKRSCPAVSQIWSLNLLSSICMVLILKSTPIVATQLDLKSCSQNRIRMFVLPTPLSPIMMSLTRQSQLSSFLLTRAIFDQEYYRFDGKLFFNQQFYIAQYIIPQLYTLQEKDDTNVIIQIPLSKMGRKSSDKNEKEKDIKKVEEMSEAETKKSKQPNRQKKIKRKKKPKNKKKKKESAQSDPQPIPEQIPIQYFHHEQDDYICPLCLQYMVHAVCLPCGHSFCEKCANEYLLFFDECIKCDLKLRDKQLNYSIVLDQLVRQFIRINHPDELERYQVRVNQWRDWNIRKKPSEFETGLRIDIRDQNYVWGTAMIYRISHKSNEAKTKILHLRYDTTDKKEEVIQQSPRLASLGFYTSRKDIPHYKRDRKIINEEYLQFEQNQRILNVINQAQE